MKKTIIRILILCCLQNIIYAQANGFGFKMGPSMGFQKWGNYQRDPLLRFHVAAFVDSESSDSKNVVYAQLGYHIKGGAILISSFVDQNNNIYSGGSFGMEFHNLSLDLGLRRIIRNGEKWLPYYAIGLRGEYTLKTSFEIYENLEEWTCKWNYGFSLKIGSEFKFSKLVHGGVELNIAPDLSKQIYVPSTIRRYNHFTNQPEPGYEQSTVNTTIELSFYLRFLQLIEYVD